jgi:hypothetical protein
MGTPLKMSVTEFHNAHFLESEAMEGDGIGDGKCKKSLNRERQRRFQARNSDNDQFIQKERLRKQKTLKERNIEIEYLKTELERAAKEQWKMKYEKLKSQFMAAEMECQVQKLFENKGYGILGDGGFSFNPRYEDVQIGGVTPKKTPQKTRQNPHPMLTAEEKEKNKVIASCQVVVENMLVQLKYWKILAGKF